MSRVVWICVAVFLLAFAARFLTWQNNKNEMAGVQYVLTQLYMADAGKLLAGDLSLFLTGENPPVDATVLLHPPGYPIFIAVVKSLTGNGGFLFGQLLVNSLAPLISLLIARRLYDLTVGTIAGLLVALAPQFSYHSGLLLPDELAVLPILLAVYFLIRSVDERRIPMVIACGAALGISCWFRSNALIMPLFFAAALVILLPKFAGFRLAAILLAAFIVVIAPITLRNYVVFRTFVPLSLGMGTTFVEGLGDYDESGALGMPRTDEGVMEMDVRIASRPDYYGMLYSPDGIERDRVRLRVGLAVVAANPGWYVGSVIHRGISTLRLERVPSISPDRDERETTHAVLYWANVPLKTIQKGFITAVFLPLVFGGLIVLMRNKDGRVKALLLLIVPLYYMSVQALIHTEYRYVLATQHLLAILAAVSIAFVARRVHWTLTDRQRLANS